MIRFDPEAREIMLSVRDLVSLDAALSLRCEPSLALRARAGAEAHLEHRREASSPGRREDYRAERPVEVRLERRGYGVTIEGRIDGLYREGERLIVEEVKSVILDPARFAPGEIARAVLEEGAFAAYRLQLETYVFMLSRSLAGAPSAPARGPSHAVIGRLVLRNLDPEAGRGASVTVEVVPEIPAVEAWIEGRLDRVIDRVEAGEALRAARRGAGDRIAFPFPRERPHQGELMEEVSGALARGEHLMVSAPTGVGKTAAVLVAALRFALPRGLKVFYVTSKTTQQRLVAETLERIAAASLAPAGGASAVSPDVPPFRSAVLRAKEKVCPNLAEEGFIYCHEDFCRYARDYAPKVEASGALGKLLGKAVALPEEAVALGKEALACPFELSLDAALESDVIVGDYNYVFDPRSHLGRFFGEWKAKKTVLIIDEAHNLYSRGRASYSPAIARRDVAALGRWAREGGAGAEASPRLAALCRKLEGLLASFSALGREEMGDPATFPVELDPEAVRSVTEELDSIRTRRLVARRLPGREASPPGPGPDPLDEFAARWEDFASAVECLEGAPSLMLYDKSGRSGGWSLAGGAADGGPGGHRLRVLALDPSVPLGRRIAAFHSAIAISATLEPLEFYRDVLGFPAERTRTFSFPSPFPEENRKVLVWDRVSTYFRSRSRDGGEVARIIEEVVSARPGNYLACFSSYAYLREVLAHFSPSARERCVVQSPGMTEAERDGVLSALREPGSARTVLAVQGGIFTEGVDYPGDMLIGAIVIGPGLPAVTYDEERVREHFEDRYQQGFEYAYLYPGMNRVIQCAGRVIRSETDTGVIVLLGERFSRRQYSRLFPAHWYRSSPRELVSEDLRRDLEEFWGSRRGLGTHSEPEQELLRP